jgi:hypothetical protein
MSAFRNSPVDLMMSVHLGEADLAVGALGAWKWLTPKVA